jgi:hypothetical protein
MQQKKYYAYTLAYPGGEVFYVGKGTKKRMNQHVIEATHPERSAYRNRRKLRVIRKIWASGEQVQKAIIFDTDIEEEAYIYEWALINMTCMGENLTNISTSGRRRSFLEAEAKPKPKTPQFEPVMRTIKDVEPIMRHVKSVEPTMRHVKCVEPIAGQVYYIGKSLSQEVDGETYYTASEAARYLGIARDTYNRNVRDRIPVYHLGALRREYFRQSDLDRYRGARPVEDDDDEEP